MKIRATGVEGVMVHSRGVGFRAKMRPLIISVLFVCSVACTKEEPAQVPPIEVPAQCRAGSLPEGTSPHGEVRRVPAIAVPPVRLVEGPFVSKGGSRVGKAHIERVSGRAIRQWPVEPTPLGPRRRSPPFEMTAERADTLVLEVAGQGVSSLDVTVVPNVATLTAVERLHRTVRLDIPASGSSTHVFEVALGPLLRGSWQDGRVSGSSRFRIEIDAELEPNALRGVEVQPRSARFDQPTASRVDGPSGALRPSFHLRGGSSLRLPVSASTVRRTLVFFLYAPMGRPHVQVRLPGQSRSSAVWTAPRKGWSRHEVQIAPGEGGDLRFDARGEGVVLIGDPTLWPAAERPRPPDLVIYLVDTLLASRLGSLGSTVPGVSPVMDTLVNGGLSFVRATSTSPWTKPAIPSLLTGVYPLTHRVGTRNYTDRVADRAPMLQQRFRQAGFRTLSSSASPLGSTLSGLERGFDLAHPPGRWSGELGPLGHPEARQVQSALLSFIDEDPSRPVFAYLHTLDVHEYEQPMFANGTDDETPYDRAIRHQDAALGELLDGYRSRDRDLIVVLVSDHGEGFGEYGLKVGHGYSVRQNQLHVPIVFYGPRWLPTGRLTAPASLVDIAPTLLDLYSLPGLPGAQGRSLLPGPKAEVPPSAVYAERTWFLWEPDGPALLARVGADGRKLVVGYPRPVSWDLQKSPCEDTAHGFVPDPGDLADLRRFLQEQRAAAAWWDAAYGASKPGRIDPDDVARLRALGYLE